MPRTSRCGRFVPSWRGPSKPAGALLGAAAVAAVIFCATQPGTDRFSPHTGAGGGRIHFAVGHTSAWAGWMQGVLEFARRVVREING